jgi:hypothetical protein
LSREASVEFNSTIRSAPPRLYLCPAEPARALGWNINYAGNLGRRTAHGLGTEDGVFINRPLSARDIEDGLSSTAGVSEWTAGDEDMKKVSGRYSKYHLARVYIDPSARFDEFVRDCKALFNAELVTYLAPKGHFWTMGPNLGGTSYNHLVTPNGPSCQAAVDIDATTAGSYHGATCTLFMDGSVRTVKDSIDPRVWAAAGTRARGEVAEPIE